jgi:hypothetical protein
MSVSLGLAISVSSACLVVFGCGREATEGTTIPEEAKKTAKYRELFPEQFKSEKKKATRRR